MRMIRTTDMKENLCDTCVYHPATCPSKSVAYGTGVGNDNIIGCAKYREKAITQKEQEE